MGTSERAHGNRADPSEFVLEPDEVSMIDRKLTAEKKHRSADGQEFEVKHLAERTDLSPAQARELLRRYGNDCGKIRKEAENFKAEG